MCSRIRCPDAHGQRERLDARIQVARAFERLAMTQAPHARLRDLHLASCPGKRKSRQATPRWRRVLILESGNCFLNGGIGLEPARAFSLGELSRLTGEVCNRKVAWSEAFGSCRKGLHSHRCHVAH